MNAIVPLQIDTERLLLRQLVEEDWHALHEHYSDEDAVRFTLGNALTEGETWRTMAAMVGHWQLRGFGPYAVELKACKSVLGTVGYWYPNDWVEPEINWALSRQYWGNGYASEAARAVQKVSIECFAESPLISFINANNQPSIKLATAIGATLENKIELPDGDWHIYRHPEAC
jgi:RimJ/RimL family protein N-acetyltransferase